MTANEEAKEGKELGDEKIVNDDDISYDDVQFLTFKLGKEEYAVDIMMVREIKGWVPSTRLPNSSSYIMGVMNLRGLIIPLYDLRVRFGQGQTNASEKHVIIVLNAGTRTIGILVDAVSDILSTSKKEVKPAPSTGNKIDNEYINGLISQENRMVVVLDVNSLFINNIDVQEDKSGKAA